MTLVLAGLVWWLRPSAGLAVFVALALLFIVNQGYWSDTMTTLTLTLIAFSTTISRVNTTCIRRIGRRGCYWR